MARLFTSGFEFQVIDTAAASRAEEVGYRNVGTPTIDTTVKRSGAASLKTSNPAAVSYARFANTTAFVVDRDFYARTYIRVSSVTPAGVVGFLRAENGAGGRVAEVKLTTTGTLRLHDSANAQIGSDSSALSADTWYRVELRFRVNGTTGTAGNAELRLTADTPGATPVVVASSIGAANLGTTTAARVHVGNVTGTSPGIDLWVDDFAVNDDQGSDENSWCGPGKIILMKAFSDTVIINGWKNGASGTTNLANAVDNTPPVGVALGSATATTQIRNAVAAVGDAYIAATQTYSAEGLVSTDRVKLVQAVAAIGNSTTTSRSVNLNLDTNPSGSVTGQVTGTTAAATYPTGWTVLRGLISYAPTVTLGDPVLIQLTKGEATAEESQACLLGAYVEYSLGILDSKSDSVTADDAQAKEPGLVKADSVSASDQASLEPGLVEADSVSATDTQAVEVDVNLAETASITDALVLADEAALGDSVTVTDQVTADLTEAHETTADDSVTVTDDVTTELNPVVAVTDGGGWALPVRIPRRAHLLTLDDLVLVSDDLEVESRMDPAMQREEELVLALL